MNFWSINVKDLREIEKYTEAARLCACLTGVKENRGPETSRTHHSSYYCMDLGQALTFQA